MTRKRQSDRDKRSENRALYDSKDESKPLRKHTRSTELTTGVQNSVAVLLSRILNHVIHRLFLHAALQVHPHSLLSFDTLEPCRGLFKNSLSMRT